MTAEQRPTEPATGSVPVVEGVPTEEQPEAPVAIIEAPARHEPPVPAADPLDPEKLSDEALEAELDALLAEPAPTVPRAAPRAPRAVLGVSAFLLSLLFSLGTGIALALFFAEALDAATIVAFTAIGLTTASFAFGLLAVLLGKGRGWGVAAMAISLISNPFVLVVGLGAVQGWTS